jgi:hypothetical protein
MITSEQITKAGFLNTNQLEKLIQKNYPKDKFMATKFLGITNGKEFAYLITYLDELEGKVEAGKVFVSIDQAGKLQAEY